MVLSGHGPTPRHSVTVFFVVVVLGLQTFWIKIRYVSYHFKFCTMFNCVVYRQLSGSVWSRNVFWIFHMHSPDVDNAICLPIVIVLTVQRFPSTHIVEGEIEKTYMLQGEEVDFKKGILRHAMVRFYLSQNYFIIIIYYYYFKIIINRLLLLINIFYLLFLLLLIIIIYPSHHHLLQLVVLVVLLLLLYFLILVYL